MPEFTPAFAIMWVVIFVAFLGTAVAVWHLINDPTTHHRRKQKQPTTSHGRAARAIREDSTA